MCRPAADYALLVCSLCRPFTDTAGVIEFFLTAIFAVDMFLMFRVAYRDNEAYVTDRSKIAAKYFECALAASVRERQQRGCPASGMCNALNTDMHCRWRFWVDLIALVPLDYVVLSLADHTDQGHWLVYANCARILRMVSCLPYASMPHSSYSCNMHHTHRTSITPWRLMS